MILLSVDTEEFDIPCENGLDYDPVGQGMMVSEYGTNRILDIFKAEGVRATFFCTTTFAENAPKTMQRIISEGHEVAAHGCDHLNPIPEDIRKCKQRLLELTGVEARGWRQPRMFPVDNNLLKQEGYLYNTSLNPAFIPGRYMHLTTPRIWHMQDEVIQIPASVSPWLRIPMFWLSIHHFPLRLYKALVRRIVKHDGYFNTYVHPWEFYPLSEHPELKIPFVIRRNSGENMCQRMTDIIRFLKQHSAEFITYSELCQRFVVRPNEKQD